MSVFWCNRFNGRERGGPFDTVELAKADAVDTYCDIQNGFAFDIAIEKDGQIVAEGFIKQAVWHDGEFEETQEEYVARLAKYG